MDPAVIAPEPASGGRRPESPPPSMLGTLRRHGVKILRNAAIITLVVIAGSFLIPNKFTAATLLLPPSETNDLSSLFSGMSGALALTRAFGMSGQAGTDVYLGVLRSATVSSRLVKRFGLARVYHSRDEEQAGKTLRSHTALTLTNEGFVKISVTERDRHLAADLANAYADELDAFLRLNTNTTARQRREFIEKRLAETKTVLANAENALQEHQVSGHLPSVGGDVLRTSQVIGELMSQKVGREVELGTLQGVARGPNARVDQLRAEIRQIDAQISSLPPIVTRLGRLYRTVSIHEKVLLVLTEEYERVRMLELRNIPTVEVVDVAHPPLHKSQPRRALFALAAFLVASVAGSVLSWIREGALRAA